MAIVHLFDFSLSLSLIISFPENVKLVLGILDLVLNFPGYLRWKFTNVLRNILKIILSLAWSIILPACYVHQNNNSFGWLLGNVKDVLGFLDKFKGLPSLYIMAVVVYLLPNLLAALLFIFPMLRRWIENSDWLIVRFLLWWSQVLFILHSTIYLNRSGIIISYSNQ